MKISRRIEKLEETFAQWCDPVPPKVLNIDFVDSEGTVVEIRVIELARPHPFKRRKPASLRR
jgi:hypothetical protein